jgi:hypothetical protein
MTSGNRVLDNTSLTTKTGLDCLGPVLYTGIRVGRKIQKQWSGGDQAASNEAPKRFEIFKYQFYDPQGRPAGYRKIKCRVPLTARPKLGEHAYSMLLTDNDDVAVAMFSPGVSCSNKNIPIAYTSSEAMGGIKETYENTWTSNDQIALVGKLGDKINGETFNMLVFLGEGREALQTIAAASKRIANALRHLRKGNVQKAGAEFFGKKSSKLKKLHPSANGLAVTDDWVSSRWLELQYGWKPLLSDIHAAAAHFAYMQNRPRELTYRKGSPKRDPSQVTSSGGNNYTLGGTAEHRVSIKAKVTLLNEAKMLGLMDPASLAWEKLPYSFVADWFIPIGSYLNALNVERSLTATYVTSHLYKKVVTSESFRSNTGAKTYYDAYFNHTQVRMERTVASSLGIRPPQIKTWDKITTFVHAVNAVALVSQVFSTPLRSR